MSIDFAALRRTQILHDTSEHTPHIIGRGEIEDPSCDICHPVELPSLLFLNFWAWYQEECEAERYSFNTQRAFLGLCNTTFGGRRRRFALDLILATRFAEAKEEDEDLFDNLVLEIGYLLGEESESEEEELTPPESFETANNYQFTPPDLTDASEEISTVVSDQDSQEQQEEDYQQGEEFEDEEPDQNLMNGQNINNNPLAGLNQNQIQQMEAALQALTAQLARNHAVSLPVFAGTSHEDPVKWLEEVNRISRANGFDGAYKLQIIGAYIKDAAAIWYDGDRANIGNWEEANNQAFTRRFLNQYRTQNKLTQWRQELEKRTQLPGEIVEAYAREIKRLVKRIDIDDNWNEA